jgi:hypothetical protein
MAVNLDNTLFVKNLMYNQQLLDQQRQERLMREQQAHQDMTQAMRDFQEMMKMYEASRQATMQQAIALATAQGKSAGEQNKEVPIFNTPEQQAGAEAGFGTGHQDFVKLAGEQARWEAEQKYRQQQLAEQVRGHDISTDYDAARLNLEWAKMQEANKNKEEYNKLWQLKLGAEKAKTDNSVLNTKIRAMTNLVGTKAGLEKATKPSQLQGLIDPSQVESFAKKMQDMGVPIDSALQALSKDTGIPIEALKSQINEKASGTTEEDFINK